MFTGGPGPRAVQSASPHPTHARRRSLPPAPGGGAAGTLAGLCRLCHVTPCLSRQASAPRRSGYLSARPSPSARCTAPRSYYRSHLPRQQPLASLRLRVQPLRTAFGQRRSPSHTEHPQASSGPHYPTARDRRDSVSTNCSVGSPSPPPFMGSPRRRSIPAQAANNAQLKLITQIDASAITVANRQPGSTTTKFKSDKLSSD